MPEERLKHDVTGERTARYGVLREIAGLIHTNNPKIIAGLVENPSLTSEIASFLIRSKRLNQDQICLIAENKRLIGDYHVRVEIVSCSLTPKHIALKYVKDLYYQDLAMVSRNTGIPLPVREVAENFLKVRLESLRLGEKISLARIAIGATLGFLLQDPDLQILDTALLNPRLSEMDLVRFISDSRTTPEKLDRVCSNSRWNSLPSILNALSLNTRLGYASRRRVYERLPLNHLVQLIRSPQFHENYRTLARFVFCQRVRQLSEALQAAMALTHSRLLIDELIDVVNTPKAIYMLLDNPKVTSDDVRRMRQKNSTDDLIRIIQEHPRWKHLSQV